MNLRHRLESRLAARVNVTESRPPFDASVRQAEIFVGKYWITTVMDDGTKSTRPAIGNAKLLSDAAYDAGAKGVTLMAIRP